MLAHVHRSFNALAYLVHHLRQSRVEIHEKSTEPSCGRGNPLADPPGWNVRLSSGQLEYTEQRCVQSRRDVEVREEDEIPFQEEEGRFCAQEHGREAKFTTVQFRGYFRDQHIVWIDMVGE